jgi:succinate dehydrogenase / fumarate reductase, flavoprotein subunit
MECTITAAAEGRRPRRRRFGYWRESGRFVVFKRQGGRARHRRHRQGYKITSNSWEYTGDGHALACRPAPT